jgi:hypothetical protein
MVKAAARLIRVIVPTCALALLAVASTSYASDAVVDYADTMRSTVDGWLALQAPDGFLPYGVRSLFYQVPSAICAPGRPSDSAVL